MQVLDTEKLPISVILSKAKDPRHTASATEVARRSPCAAASEFCQCGIHLHHVQSLRHALHREDEQHLPPRVKHEARPNVARPTSSNPSVRSEILISWLGAHAILVRIGRLRSALLLACCFTLPAFAKDPHAPPVQPVKFASLHIPRISIKPTLGDFLDMKPTPEVAAQMLKVDGFLQRDPRDGLPVSQKTEVYLGYTDKNLYVVCICFDSEPNKIRARLGRRELINDDDQFGFVLDTFHDRYHGLFFYVNPLGVQQDGIWVDNGQEPDLSYDMVWNSDAKLTGRGYIAWFEIPFKSLRFPPADVQTWGVFFERDIKRNSEYSFYPHITNNAQGILTQGAELDGLEKVTGGRNMQFIPYVVGRAFRNLDDRDPANPYFGANTSSCGPALIRRSC